MSVVERNGLYYLNGEIVYVYSCDGMGHNGSCRPTLIMESVKRMKACNTREDKEKELLDVLFSMFNVLITMCWKKSQTKIPTMLADTIDDVISLEKNREKIPSYAIFCLYYICFDTRKMFHLYHSNGEIVYKIFDSI